MTSNDNNKTPMNLSPFPINVLGGVFHVLEIMLGLEETREEVVAILNATPADRWFVMVSDHAGEAHDALAMIDDNLEFQIYAHGVLRQE